MNAKEARELTRKGNEPCCESEDYYETFHEAKGYLAALEGPEVKALVDTLEYYVNTYPRGYEFEGKSEKALAAYYKAIGK